MPVLTTVMPGRPSCRPMSSMTSVGRRGGQREHGRIAERLDGVADLEEGRSEIVAPLRDAVRFVDHEQIDALLLQHAR